MDPKDKRVKREIANSNERRRMQSINAGFQKLKRLLPVRNGDKLSKAAILQNASEFILQIEREKLVLYEQNTLLRQIILDIKGGTSVTTALESIDLDTLPRIPINTQIDMMTNDSTLNTSNDSHLDDMSSHDDSMHGGLSVKLEKSSQDQLHYRNQQHHKENHPDSKVNERLIAAQAATHVVIKSSPDNFTTGAITTTTIGSTFTTTTSNPSSAIAQATAVPATTDLTKQTSNSAAGATNISDMVTSPKAAIALPLEVPYTSETATRVDSKDPKGQNLDTICKAIIEIEGDRVFNG